MNTVMVIEIIVGVVVLVAAVRFAVRETRNLSAAMESEAEPVETTPAPGSEAKEEPKAEQPVEQKAESDLSEVSAAEAK
jgi:hypothetical protein